MQAVKHIRKLKISIKNDFIENFFFIICTPFPILTTTVFFLLYVDCFFLFLYALDKYIISNVQAHAYYIVWLGRLRTVLNYSNLLQKFFHFLIEKLLKRVYNFLIKAFVSK